jgi:hypothetical protein
MKRIKLRQLSLYFYLLRINFGKPRRDISTLKRRGRRVLKKNKIAVLLEAANTPLIAVGIFVNTLFTYTFSITNDSSQNYLNVNILIIKKPSIKEK